MCTRNRLWVILMFGMLLFPARILAEGDGLTELTCGEGQRIYVLLPEDYDSGRQYPCVYFMPQDGYSAQDYLEDGTIDTIRTLEAEQKIEEMIFAFVELSDKTRLDAQTDAMIAAMQQEYSVIPDAAHRGIIGTKTGGYLAFLLGYGAANGEIQKKPDCFGAIASHDGDFVSKENPFLKEYGSVCSMLKPEIAAYGVDTEWLRGYYTYLDCDGGNALSWEKEGSADLASLYRSDSLYDPDSPQAWDYSVFEYVIQDSVQYGSWTDHLERSLKGFSDAFYTDDTKQEALAETETEYRAKETILLGGERSIDLMGNWYFYTADAIRKQDPDTDASNVEEILAADWRTWDVVQPGMDWWTENFAACLDGNAYYTGYAWYVREFEVPEAFERSSLQINAGMMDEADEVYINGTRVGQTGIPDEGGSYDGTNPWDEERIYEIPDDLLDAGINTIAVRVCNGSGAGGWYAGPIQIEAKKETAEDPQRSQERYYQTSFSSKALKGQEISYGVYLPAGYYESDLRYPVVYMLHGYGSTGKSFEIAGVPGLLDEGISEGEIPLCIMIFPSDGHPQKAGWWSGAYAQMLNEDLVREVDRTLRTVDSREYRFLAGESMGGGGAYLNALNHPELYGGVLDIYGALRFTGALKTFLEMDADALGQFRHFILCGSHDMYSFDLDHIMMGKHLFELQIPFRFEIDNGEHSASFYLPRLKEGLAYLLESAEPVDGSGNVITETEP